MARAFFKGDATGSGFSPNLWADFPAEEIAVNNNRGYEFFDEFLYYNGAGTAKWVEAQSGSGTVEQGDAVGGSITLNAGASTQHQGMQLQLAGSSFLPAAGKTLWAEAAVIITNTSNQFFFGLAVEDNSIFSTGANSTDNHIGFEMNTTTISSDAGKLQFYGEKGTQRGTVSNVHTLVSAEEVKIGFKVTGVTKIEIFVNNVLSGSTLLTANIPVILMTPSLLCQADGSSQPTVDVNWVRFGQLRTAHG